MSYWLVVRDEQTIKPALEQAHALLATRQPSGDGELSALQGIWVDEAMTRQPPSQSTTLDIANEKLALNMHETMGLAGVWQLCRIEPANRSSGLSYDEALTGLLNFMEAQPKEQVSQALPVLCETSHENDTIFEVEQLTRLAVTGSQHLSLAWYKHSA